MISADKKTTLLVFSDDWGRHPSSCQHLIRRFLPAYRVVWVNSIGMRRPALDRVTLNRGTQKIREWFLPGKSVQTEHGPVEDISVLKPKMWPWFTRHHDRWLNRVLLEKQLKSIVDEADAPVIAISTLPIVSDLAESLAVDRWVYYCVDDFSKWPAMDQRAIDVMEESFVRRADVVITVSEKLRERLQQWGTPSHLLTHGVDLDHWGKSTQNSSVPEFEGLERPLVLFWGSIDWQMDLEFLKRLSADLNEGTIALVGPMTDVSPELARIPGVVCIPKVAYERLPELANEASVLVMPYLDAPGLRESQPLKLKEYLASGKPAVVRDLPANRVWADAFDLVASAEDFSTVVRQRIAGGLPESQAQARLRLKSESWDEKALQFERFAITST